MKVYVLEHDDRMYDMGDKYIRGIYTTEAVAQAALPVKATMRRLHYDGDGHDADCCGVEEWTVEEPAHAIPLTDPPHGD